MYNNLRNCSAESIKDWFITEVNIIENVLYLNQIENKEKAWNNIFRRVLWYRVSFNEIISIFLFYKFTTSKFNSSTCNMDLWRWLITLETYIGSDD